MTLQRLKGARLPIAAALAASVLAASAARAAATPDKLVLSGYGDSAAGAQLLAGEYAAVIEKLAPHRGDFDKDEVAASTNLCVAYVATGQLDEAQEACDEAIAMARLEPFGITLQDHMAHQEALSMAYANRAVLTRLSGE